MQDESLASLRQAEALVLSHGSAISQTALQTQDNFRSALTRQDQARETHKQAVSDAHEAEEHRRANDDSIRAANSAKNAAAHVRETKLQIGLSEQQAVQATQEHRQALKHGLGEVRKEVDKQVALVASEMNDASSAQPGLLHILGMLDSEFGQESNDVFQNTAAIQPIVNTTTRTLYGGLTATFLHHMTTPGCGFRSVGEPLRTETTGQSEPVPEPRGGGATGAPFAVPDTRCAAGERTLARGNLGTIHGRGKTKASESELARIVGDKALKEQSSGNFLRQTAFYAAFGQNFFVSGNIAALALTCKKCYAWYVRTGLYRANIEAQQQYSTLDLQRVMVPLTRMRTEESLNRALCPVGSRVTLPFTEGYASSYAKNAMDALVGFMYCSMPETAMEITGLRRVDDTVSATEGNIDAIELGFDTPGHTYAEGNACANFALPVLCVVPAGFKQFDKATTWKYRCGTGLPLCTGYEAVVAAALEDVAADMRSLEGLIHVQPHVPEQGDPPANALAGVAAIPPPWTIEGFELLIRSTRAIAKNRNMVSTSADALNNNAKHWWSQTNAFMRDDYRDLLKSDTVPVGTWVNALEHALPTEFQPHYNTESVHGLLPRNRTSVMDKAFFAPGSVPARGARHDRATGWSRVELSGVFDASPLPTKGIRAVQKSCARLVYGDEWGEPMRVWLDMLRIFIPHWARTVGGTAPSAQQGADMHCIAGDYIWMFFLYHQVLWGHAAAVEKHGEQVNATPADPTFPLAAAAADRLVAHAYRLRAWPELQEVHVAHPPTEQAFQQITQPATIAKLCPRFTRSLDDLRDPAMLSAHLVVVVVNKTHALHDAGLMAQYLAQLRSIGVQAYNDPVRTTLNGDQSLGIPDIALTNVRISGQHFPPDTLNQNTTLSSRPTHRAIRGTHSMRTVLQKMNLPPFRVVTPMHVGQYSETAQVYPAVKTPAARRQIASCLGAQSAIAAAKEYLDTLPGPQTNAAGAAAASTSTDLGFRATRDSAAGAVASHGLADRHVRDATLFARHARANKRAKIDFVTARRLR